MMRYTWKVGSAFRIGIFLHWTFWLLPAGTLAYHFVTAGWEPALLHVSLLLSLFVCVVLHEYGHALTARRFGINTRDITLYPIGGVARLEGIPEDPWAEFWIAVAGPAVNVVIAAALGLFLVALGWYPSDQFPASPTWADFPLLLSVMNVFLVLFNMLPVFPMDGGRVLRALLSLGLGRLRATEVAFLVGLVFVVLFGIAAVAWPAPMLGVLAFFVYLFGRQELAALRYQEQRRSQERMLAEPATVIPVRVEEGFSGFAWDDRARAWVWWQNGRPVHAYYEG